MTRRYEIVYIFDSAQDESQINESLDRHHALLKPEGESEFLLETNHWGKRTLAYPIGNSEVGHYVVVNLKTDGAKLQEFERAVKLDESIIRYLVVLNEGEMPVPIEHPDDRKDSDDEVRSVKPKAEAEAVTAAAPAAEEASPAVAEDATAKTAGEASPAVGEDAAATTAGESGGVTS